MKKTLTLPMILILIMLCGCNGNQENSEKRFVLNTVATITADSDGETLDGAFELCEELEKELSRTIAGSDVYKLNSIEGFVKVSDRTLKIIERSLYYSELSDGKFDISICPVSELWDFNNQVIPSRDEIAEALQNVDYQSIEIKENTVNLNGKRIDLGGIAKGYIADCVRDYFKSRKVTDGIINLGGNVIVFGKSRKIGIQNPFGEGVIANIELKDKSVVTSGIYERCIKKDGRIYHHILDTSTGYGVENELAAVTVIGKSSFDGDALSTVCMLSGTQKGIEIIENTPNTEAIFIGRDESITLTSGLYRSDTDIMYK